MDVVKISRELERARRARREARGSGHGNDYVGLYQVTRNDFASHGRARRHPSMIMRRQHHLLSDLELHALFYVQLKGAVDIRENYPLRHCGVEEEFAQERANAEGTVKIAEKMGLSHPCFDDREKTLKTFSTDLLVDLKSRKSIAISVKYERERAEAWPALSEKIQRTYWQQRNVEFLIFNEDAMKPKAIANLKMMLRFEPENLAGTKSEWLSEVAFRAQFESIGAVMEKMANAAGILKAAATDRVKAAVATGALVLDLSLRHLDWGQTWPRMDFRHENFDFEPLLKGLVGPVSYEFD